MNAQKKEKTNRISIQFNLQNLISTCEEWNWKCQNPFWSKRQGDMPQTKSGHKYFTLHSRMQIKYGVASPLDFRLLVSIGLTYSWTKKEGFR